LYKFIFDVSSAGVYGNTLLGLHQAFIDYFDFFKTELVISDVRQIQKLDISLQHGRYIEDIFDDYIVRYKAQSSEFFVNDTFISDFVLVDSYFWFTSFYFWLEHDFFLLTELEVFDGLTLNEFDDAVLSVLPDN